MAPSGVDASFSGWLDFGSGFTAAFETSFEAPERQVLKMAGTRARLVIKGRAFTPGVTDTAIQVWYAGGNADTIRCPGNDPYEAMIEHFAAAVRGAEPLRRTPAESIAMLELLDRLREAAQSQG
jgi:predicted dehydrogenase